MTGHRPGVAEAEVDVVVAVDVAGTGRPSAASTNSGNGPAQRIIQFIGTPSRSEPLARSSRARERGWRLEAGHLAAIRRARRARSRVGWASIA